MSRVSGFLVFACFLAASAVTAGDDLATGKLLVATDEVRGAYFAQTVILILHYNEQGAMGLVINRPMEAAPKELLPDLEGLDVYSGALYWGGPVQVSTMRALLRSDAPPEDALHIFDSVHQVPFDETLHQGPSNAAQLRFFVGYAGWAPGQLERELAFDSWQVIPATEEVVFARDPGMIWRYLRPPREYRAAMPPSPLRHQAYLAPARAGAYR
ncbi:MAG: YqgE/AlgH family protein [Woeseia sp.]